MQLKSIEETIKNLFELWADGKSKQPIQKVRYSGIDFGKEEYTNMLDAIFNGWWSNGKYTIECERKLAEKCGRNHALLCNSGSTANLILMLALAEKHIPKGSKILTMACGFPTTVNPIIHAGFEPVFADIDLDTLSINIADIPDGVKGIFIPHTLGFVGNINELLDYARDREIVVAYDACDAYGSTYDGKPVTAYGKASTLSFYAAHHISCGEGGAIVTNDTDLFLTMRGIRNWGRYCSSMECCTRSINPESFCPDMKYTADSEVPTDYNANYQFEWLGYNFKMLDLQAGILNAQIDRLESYNAARVQNYNTLYDALKNCNLTVWALPEGISPFSVPILFPDDKSYKRKLFMDFLRQNKIESRMMFAGNLLRHPAYKSYKNDAVGDLANSDRMMNCGMMLGCSHVIDGDKLLYMVLKIKEFFK